MKNRMFMIFTLTLMFISLIAASSKEKVLFGTWVNPEYEDVKYWNRSSKRVIDPNLNAFGENIESDIGKPSGSMGYYSKYS